MRKAIIGVGSLLIVVGLIQLILSISLVGGIKAQVIEQIDAPIAPAIEDATDTLTDVADALDGGVDFLKDMDTTLADVETMISGTIGDSLQYLGDLDATLADAGRTVTDITDTVTDITDNVASTQDATEEWLEGIVLEITASDLKDWAHQLEYAGWDASGLRAWADYLTSEGITIAIFPLELGAENADAMVEVFEASGLDASGVQAWADYLRSEGLVWTLTPKDVAEVFTPVVESLDLAGESLDLTSDSLSDISDYLGTVQTTLQDVEELAVDSLSDVKGYLTTAQADLGDIGGGLRAMSADIEGLDVSGMVGGVLDGVIGPLQMYMIFSSVLFMLAGAGLLLTGLVLRTT